MKHFLPEWAKLTSDKSILDCAAHYHIDFLDNEFPVQHTVPNQIIFSETEQRVIDSEILKLLEKGVVKRCEPKTGDFVSTVFLRPKKDGNYCMILNLKKLNSFVEYHHFEMDTLTTAIKMMRPGCYMASVYLKDAYYTVPIAQEHQKFLKFFWRGQMYRFTCLPNGPTCASRVFTKLLKPLFATLRKLGHLCFGYIDDTYLQGDTANECSKTIDATVALFQKVGFIIHPEKSVLQPVQRLVFIGFIVDSLLMIIRLIPEKATKAKDMCLQLFSSTFPSLQELAEVIGLIVSSFPGVMYGPLHYRALESAKSEGLRAAKGDYSFRIALPSEAKHDLQWWIDNTQTATNPVNRDPPCKCVQSDASLIGWGAVCEGVTTGGR